MATISKLEIDFRRLLERCEVMVEEVQDNKENINWRLEKYVLTLQRHVSELKKSTSKPSADTLNEYSKKVEFLKGFIETQKLKSPNEKLHVSHQLVRPASHAASKTTQDTGHPPERSQQLHIRAKSHINKEVRNELLGTDDQKDPEGPRKRLTAEQKGNSKDNSIDAVLQYHHNMQEKVAEEMIIMAQSLKHTSVMASNIIKEDKKTLESSTRLADSNFEKLKRESERLEELTQRPCSLWIWIMLITVCVVFMFMIIFIRLFPKK